MDKKKSTITPKSAAFKRAQSGKKLERDVSGE